mgnify:CR=1 FL=1
MSQTLNASTLLVVPLAPLVGSALAGIFGTQFGGNWIGRRLSHTLTILGVLVAFILSAMTLKSVIDGARFNETLYTWMVVGGLKMEIGFLVDGALAGAGAEDAGRRQEQDPLQPRRGLRRRHRGRDRRSRCRRTR